MKVISVICLCCCLPCVPVLCTAVVVCLMCCRQAYHSPCFGHHKKGGDCWKGELFTHE